MNYLELERHKANLTQRELSKLAHVGQNYISFAESSGFVPTNNIQDKLAKALNWQKEPRALFCEVIEDGEEIVNMDVSVIDSIEVQINQIERELNELKNLVTKLKQQ